MTKVFNIFKGYETFKVEVNGINLNYAKIGLGKPLIFIHGWTNNWEGWIPLAEKLKKFFTLYLIDLPGFGDSDNLPRYTLEGNARYTAQFLHNLGEKAAGVIGLSMGSFVVSELAIKYPDLCQKAVLLAPLIKEKEDKIIYQSIFSILSIFDKTTATRILLKHLITRKWLAYFMCKYVNMYRFNKSYVDKYGTNGRRKMRIEAFIDMGFSINNYDFKKVLTGIRIPTLMVYGREDKIAKAQEAAKLLSKNKNLSLKVIPFAGHMVHWEQTEKVAKTIRLFISRL